MAKGDLDGLMEFMTDDRIFRTSVGVEPGTTFSGRAEVRPGFALMPAYDAGLDVPDGDAFIAGNQGAVRWSCAGTDDAGQVRRVYGCDLFGFDSGRIRVKGAHRRVRGEIGDASAGKA